MESTVKEPIFVLLSCCVFKVDKIKVGLHMSVNVGDLPKRHSEFEAALQAL
ncbi:Hypothetical protein FKW44_019486 [Caligus rogercresseyi]|uniref:Uncharacterized protein n=1 Tax=Caligus rogercresseyi TaxID=217165 RepID=A0A7T8GVW6_CALRO|nr:Hypothetical protein FKW44_019486 [Caligus rogercresseyi]